MIVHHGGNTHCPCCPFCYTLHLRNCFSAATGQEITIYIRPIELRSYGCFYSMWFHQRHGTRKCPYNNSYSRWSHGTVAYPTDWTTATKNRPGLAKIFCGRRKTILHVLFLIWWGCHSLSNLGEAECLLKVMRKSGPLNVIRNGRLKWRGSRVMAHKKAGNSWVMKHVWFLKYTDRIGIWLIGPYRRRAESASGSGQSSLIFSRCLLSCGS